jgi:hypothetical protein
MFSAIDADAQKSKTLKKFKKTNQKSISKTNFDPALPSNYYSNVGIGILVPTETSNTNHILAFGGEIAFSPKSKLEIYTGYYSIEDNYYPNSYFGDLKFDFRQLLVKNRDQVFESLELDIGTDLPIGKLGVDGNESSMGLRVGISAGFKITDNFYMFPLLNYTYSFNIEGDYDYSHNFYRFGLIIPFKISRRVFFRIQPVLNYYSQSVNSTSQGDDTILQVTYSINFQLGKTVLLSGIYLTQEEPNLNFWGATASFYMH